MTNPDSQAVPEGSGGYRDRILTGQSPGGNPHLDRAMGLQDVPPVHALGAYSVPGKRGAVPCILGLDPSPTKLGWGVVLDCGGEPVDCGVVAHDGVPEDVKRGVRGLGRVLEARNLEPCFALMEKPGGRGASGGFDEGFACGMVWSVARSLWPWVTINWTTASHWRSVTGVPIMAPPEIEGDSRRRRWLKDRSVERAQALGFDLPETGKRVIRPSDDAAEGGLIARCAWSDLAANPEWRMAA